MNNETLDRLFEEWRMEEEPMPPQLHENMMKAVRSTKQPYSTLRSLLPKLTVAAAVAVLMIVPMQNYLDTHGAKNGTPAEAPMMLMNAAAAKTDYQTVSYSGAAEEAVSDTSRSSETDPEMRLAELKEQAAYLQEELEAIYGEIEELEAFLAK